MTVYKVLDELEDLLQKSSHIPFSNRLVIEEDELCRLVDALRETIPSEIMDANRVISERKRIMEDAQKEAKSVVEQAHAYVNKLTDENAITQQANEKAEKILAESREKAKEIEERALEYADQVFEYIETNLEKVTDAIKESRGKINAK